MNARILVAAAAAALTATGVLALAAGGSTDSGPVDSGPVVHEMAADYPSFGTVGAAAAKSALVVRATVVEVGETYRHVPEGFPVKELPANKAAEAGVVQHDVTYRVDSAYKGTKADTTLRVVHLGGRIGKDVYVAEDEPASVVGSSYVLYLAPVGDGKFGVVGGPQGRYQVKDGVLTGLGEARAGVAGALGGMPLSVFETKPLG